MKFIKIVDGKYPTLINTDHLLHLRKVSTYESTNVEVGMLGGIKFHTSMTIEQIEDLINKKE